MAIDLCYTLLFSTIVIQSILGQCDQYFKEMSSNLHSDTYIMDLFTNSIKSDYRKKDENINRLILNNFEFTEKFNIEIINSSASVCSHMHDAEKSYSQTCTVNMINNITKDSYRYHVSVMVIYNLEIPKVTCVFVGQCWFADTVRFEKLIYLQCCETENGLDNTIDKTSRIVISMDEKKEIFVKWKCVGLKRSSLILFSATFDESLCENQNPFTSIEAIVFFIFITISFFIGLSYFVMQYRI